MSRRTFVTGAACASAYVGTTGLGTIRRRDVPVSWEPRSFDMHADTLDVLGMNAHRPYSGFDNIYQGTLAANNAQVSADRMGEMGWVQCYAIWIPDSEGPDASEISAIEWYREAVAWFGEQMELCRDTVVQARSFAEVSDTLDAGKVAAVLTVENAACLEAGIGVVDEFERDGVLMAGVTWNYRNVLGSGNVYPEVGLTDLGVRYVRALEERHIIVDVSHLNELGFWDLEAVATRPYVASHSNARAVCDHPRNLTDEQFVAIMARGGVVGLNFHESFVHADEVVYTFDELASHVEHWLDLGGQDTVALGSDRDGASVPTWLADCSSQTPLFERFSDRFGEQLARKLFFENAYAFFTGWGR